jgi:VCBS repeat-containing protein
MSFDPTIDGATNPSGVDEAADASAQEVGPVTGTITIDDDDSGETLSLSVSGAGSATWSEGTLPGGVDVTTLTAASAISFETPDVSDGNPQTVDWTYDPEAADLDWLGANQTLTIDFTARVNDGTSGPVDDQLLSVTITGTNDAASIDGATNPDAIEEAVDAADQSVGPVTGTITISDPDIGDTPTLSVSVDGTAVWSEGSLPGSVSVTALVASGAISFETAAASDGGSQTLDWTYDPTGADLDWLGAGETLTITYSAQVNDGSGAVGDQPLEVTITGTNDGPVISLESGDSAALTLEESSETAGNADDGAFTTGGSPAVTTGTLSFSDLDLTDTHTADVTDVVVGIGETAPPSVTTEDLLALLQLIQPITDTTDGTGGSVQYSFTGTENDFDYLADGDSVTLTYTVEVSDGTDTDTQDVTVTIAGANDAPDIEGATNPTVIAESTGDSSTQDIPDTTGTITISDPDIGDTLTLTVAGDATLVWSGGDPLPDGVDIDALIATDAISFETAAASDGGSQTLDWTYNPEAADLDWLRGGQSLTITYSARIDDGSGAAGDQELIVTINGTNDVPTIDDATNPTPVSEAADASAQEAGPVGGTITVTDQDIGDTLTFSVTGNATAVWSGGASIPVAADVSALIASGAVSFDQTGLLSDGDDVTIDWSYDPAAANLDWLRQGETLTVTYTAQVNDGAGNVGAQSLEIQITGTNDAPVIEVDGGAGDSATLALTESSEAPENVGTNLFTNTAGGGTATLTGTLSFSDADFSDEHTATVEGVTLGGTGPTPPETLDLDSLLDVTTTAIVQTGVDGTGGVITYTFNSNENNFDYLAVGETAILTYTIRVTDDATTALHDDQTVVVTITGVNDAPDAVDDVLNVAERADSVILPKVVNGDVFTNDTDPDTTDEISVHAVAAGATGTVSTGNVGVAVDGLWGALTLNANGTYSYSFFNTDEIIAGETPLVDKFHYQISDGNGGFDDAVLTVNISGTDLDLTITPAPADPHDADPFIAQRGHDIVRGTAGVDTIYGREGNDTLYGEDSGDTLYGEEGNDALWGGAGADTLNGGDGNDAIRGEAGDDTIIGGSGAGYDVYDGGDDNDTLDYSSTTGGITVDLTPQIRTGNPILGGGLNDPTTIGALLALAGIATDALVGRADGAEIGTDAIRNVENVTGGSGIDSITGDGNANVLRGGGENDVLHGAGGADTLHGDAGNDLAEGGAGNDTIVAAPEDGYDVYDGGTDIDTVDYSATTSGVTITLEGLNRSAEAVTAPDGAGGNPDTIGELLSSVSYGTTTSVGRADGSEIGTDALRDVENAIGGEGADSINGNAAANVLEGRGGIDNIWGRGGDDTIRGGDGNDILVGGFGGNAPGSGKDTIFGGDGNDQLFGEDDNDILWGGTGADQYAGGAGNDTLYFEGDGTSDTAWGGTESDTFVFQGGFGVDTIKDFIAVGTTLKDKIDLSSIAYTFSSLTIVQVGKNVEITGVGTGNKIVLEVVSVTAITADDFIFGTVPGVMRTGTNNNDTLTGTALGDFLNGSGGNDTLAGLGSGDVLIGGSGTDTATYAASAAGVDVSLTTGLGFGGDAEGDTLQTVENLIGSGQNDTLEGSSAANNLNGGGGIDTLTYKNAGAAVTVSLASTSAQSTGGAGSDTVSNFENLTGSAFNDTLTGSTGANVLKGLAGNDTINGGNGNDSLDGGIGTDTMTGGGNDDTFIFAAGYGADRITDFNVASSAEKIDLTGFEEIYSLADIAASQSGSNVVLNFGNGDTLTLNNVTLGSLTDADFVFNPEPVKSGAVPTDITLSNDTVNEGSATGTVIGSLLGIDNTDGGETFTYKLRDSAGGLFAISGSNLVVNGTLNYETATSYDIVVRVTDSGNQTYDKTFTIDLTNLGATALTDGNNAANSVAEGAATGATVGVTGLANDPGGGPLTYSLLDDAGGRFQINATTGVVTVLNGSLLDYETATSHTVTIQATDGTYAVDEDFVVNLTNVNGVTRTGNDNNNTLTGTGESDTLNGGKGNDTLTGLGGPDNLTGGNGADIFLFNFANEGVDTITDFKVGGADKIRVSASGFGGGLVAGATVSLTTTGDFAGAFSAGSNGYFIFDNAGADSGVYWDPTGGDSTDAVLFVKLSGVTSLLPSDFHVV